MGGAGQTGEGWCREPPWSGRLSRLERRIFSGPSFPPEKAVRPTWLCFSFSPLPAWDLGGDSLGKREALLAGFARSL